MCRVIIFLWIIFYVQGKPLPTEIQKSYNSPDVPYLSSNIHCNFTDCAEDNWIIKNCMLPFENDKEHEKNSDANEEESSGASEDETSGNNEEEILNDNKEESLGCHILRYNIGTYRIFLNCSALVNGTLIDKDLYLLENETLITCDFEDAEYIVICNDTHCNHTNEQSESAFFDKLSNLVVLIGSGISIIALIIHLLTFVYLPALRNISDNNLASLSIALLFGYSFTLIGYRPEVLGFFCILCGILRQYFFLGAIFFMNILAFDIWRTLKLATEELVVIPKNTRKRQFLKYSLYAWGSPMVIIIFSIVADNTSVFPDIIKPNYGINNVCWMTNGTAKALFYSAPTFTLLVVNGIFFVRSFWMISSNTMKCWKDQSKHTMKLNYILYVRLGFMMGLIWLIGIVAIASNHDVLWIIFDLFHSLQGLFLFLLFTCTKKVLKHLRRRISFRAKKTSPAMNTNNIPKFSPIKNNDDETVL